MHLIQLTVDRFRNLSHVELAPAVHASIAVGQNGQGKTNLLEAIYFLATLKPLRAHRLAELIQFAQPSTRVSGRFLLGGATRDICVEVSRPQPGALERKVTRQAFVDGKKASSLEEYFGGVSVVAFTPDDLAVVKGGPEGRRAFLDRAVFNRWPAYLAESRAYARALKSRNRLLKTGAQPDLLTAFDEPLARAGARLWSRRRALMGELAPRATEAFEAIGRTEHPACFEYAPSHMEVDFALADEAALQSALCRALNDRLAHDMERGYTSVGPHSDDVSIHLGERSARAYGSQGQQRALVLAWKVAEIENLRAALGYLPLLLLDDVSSELDPERNTFLMGYLAHSGAQVFLTTTDAGAVQRAAGQDTRWLDVRAGEVSTRPHVGAPLPLAGREEEPPR